MDPSGWIAIFLWFDGGSIRSRTGTPVRIHDFESSASTNSATEPYGKGSLTLAKEEL